ncbi:forkhead box protein C1-B-like [Takifugu rubripes]|uniref:forkhead box protein C1-B-like n=1 Tax=Takifugu rubripes TaxID=31033 RepID=UPI001145AFFC|nr:forkhead box protein C1-B-like [Takifugu rubripes]
METFGTLCAPVGSSQQRLFRKSSTYLAKIAVVLQCAPEKMLTFPQLMDHLMPIMSENRRSFENNIRVCLSTNKCFVKIPVVPDSLDSKRKYWKLDSSQITAKMARRHFKGILQLFPELASKVEAENRSRTLGGQGSLKAPEAAAAAARRVQNRREVKFSGPFSIESLLKRDGPSARTSRSSPLSGAQVRAEQQPRFGPHRSFRWDSGEPLLLHRPSGHTPVCSAGGSTHQGLTGDQAKKILTGASWPVPSRTSAAPHFTSAHSSYIRYTLPAFTHDALHFCL